MDARRSRKSRDLHEVLPDAIAIIHTSDKHRGEDQLKGLIRPIAYGAKLNGDHEKIEELILAKAKRLGITARNRDFMKCGLAALRADKRRHEAERVRRINSGYYASGEHPYGSVVNSSRPGPVVITDVGDQAADRH